MDTGFITRVLKTSGVLGLLGLIFGSFYYGFYPSLSVFTGIIWGMINLYFLEKLIRTTLRPDEIDKTKALVLLFIKFPMLYASGYFIVTSTVFDALLFLIGFSVVLLVIVLKAAGRVLLRLDDDKLKDRRGSLNSVE